MADYSLSIIVIAVTIAFFWSITSIITSNPTIQSSTTILLEGNYQDNYTSEYALNATHKNQELVISIQDQNACIELQGTTGKSMLPFQKNKGLVLIDHCFDPTKLEKNDLIVFYRQDTLEYVNHRIIEIDYENKTIVTKGDTCDYPDDPIRFSQVVGKVIGLFNIFHESKLDTLETELMVCDLNR